MAHEIPADSIEGAPVVEVDIRDTADPYPIEYEVKVFPKSREALLRRIEELGGKVAEPRHLLEDKRFVPRGDNGENGGAGNGEAGKKKKEKNSAPREASVPFNMVEGEKDRELLKQAFELMGYRVEEGDTGWNIIPPEGPLPPMLARFRKKNVKCFFTVKDQRPANGDEQTLGVRIDSRREVPPPPFDLELRDPDGFREVLKQAGYKKRSEEKKWRTPYEVEDCIIALDEPVESEGKNVESEGMWWIEVEGPSEAAVWAMVEKLGYRREDTAAVSPRKAMELLRARLKEEKQEKDK